MEKPERVRVIFRCDPNGDNVVAILPDVVANLFRVTCYSHVGQHSEGDYWVILRTTRAARAEEFDSLLREVRGIYGAVRVMKRWVSAKRSKRA